MKITINLTHLPGFTEEELFQIMDSIEFLTNLDEKFMEYDYKEYKVIIDAIKEELHERETIKLNDWSK
jgi:hypothetical protein